MFGRLNNYVFPNNHYYKNTQANDYVCVFCRMNCAHKYTNAENCQRWRNKQNVLFQQNEKVRVRKYRILMKDRNPADREITRARARISMAKMRQKKMMAADNLYPVCVWIFRFFNLAKSSKNCDVNAG